MVAWGFIRDSKSGAHLDPPPSRVCSLATEGVLTKEDKPPSLTVTSYSKTYQRVQGNPKIEPIP